MSCPHARWKEGIRTYSDRVPGYAQGAYFPDDEPGYFCTQAGQMCTDPDGVLPEECLYMDLTGWTCPKCAEEDELAPLYRNGRGIVCCLLGHSFGECYSDPGVDYDKC